MSNQEIGTISGSININVDPAISNLNKAQGAVKDSTDGMQQSVVQNFEKIEARIDQSVKNIDRSVENMTKTFIKIDDSTNNITKNFNKLDQSVDNSFRITQKFYAGSQRGAGQAAGANQNLLNGLLGFASVTSVISKLEQGIDGLIAKTLEYEKQTARISRVVAPEDRGVVNADMAEEMARTGASADQAAETIYQLGTVIKDVTTLQQAATTALNLEIGTESDARETARLLLQVYEQFPDAFGKNVSEGEKFRRVGELIATTFQGSAQETGELAQSLKYLGPIAEATKTPLEQIIGVITALSAAGVRGRMAGTETTAFLTNILKNYNQELGGVLKNGELFKFQLAKTKDGGIDLFKTLENIVAVANSLPVAQGQKFLLGVSGTSQSFRFLGAQGPESMRLIRESIEKSTAAMKGQTHEADHLKDQMMTTGQEGKRIFNEFFTLLEHGIEKSGFRDWLHGIANDYEGIAKAQKGIETADKFQADFVAKGGDLVKARDKQRILASVLAVHNQEVKDNDQGLPGEIFDAVTGRVGKPGSYSDLAAGSILGNVISPSKLMQGGVTEPDRKQFEAWFQQKHGDIDWKKVAAEKAGLDNAIKLMEAQRAQSVASGEGDPAKMEPLRKSIPGMGRLDAEQRRNAAIITEVAKKYNIDASAMLAAAHAESDLRTVNKNPKSSATGLFQELKSSFPNVNRSDPRANADAFAKEILRVGYTGQKGIEGAKFIIQKAERPDAAGVIGDIQRASDFLGVKNTGRGDFGGDRRGGIVNQAEIERRRKEAEKDAEQKRNEAERDRIARQEEVATAKSANKTALYNLNHDEKDRANYKSYLDFKDREKSGVGYNDNFAQYMGEVKQTLARAADKAKEDAKTKSDQEQDKRDKSREKHEADEEEIRRSIKESHDLQDQQDELATRAQKAGKGETDQARIDAKRQFDKDAVLNYDNALRVLLATLAQLDQQDKEAAERTRQQEAERKKADEERKVREREVTDFFIAEEYRADEISLEDYREYLRKRLETNTLDPKERERLQRTADGLDKDKKKQETEPIIQGLNSLKQRAQDVLGESLVDGIEGKWKKGFKNIEQSGIQMIEQLAAKAAILGIFNLLSGGSFGAAKGAKKGTSFLGSLFGGFDDPHNDSMAHRWGFDFGGQFQGGIDDSQRLRNPAAPGRMTMPQGADRSDRPIHVNIGEFHNHDSSVDVPTLSRQVAWHVQRELRTQFA